MATHTANFGLRKDGSFGVGYFGADDVSRGNETDWAQLVAGVVWLVREGRNYVAQSARLEDLSVQETGSSFVTVTSARHSIGHDRLGRLMLVLVNGKTGQRGVNLDSFANILVSLGALNAINLDGGTHDTTHTTHTTHADTLVRVQRR
jgi:N-acetylglucosamine-1-phosphodiester alpha-N-acetylglucosaminidase